MQISLKEVIQLPCLHSGDKFSIYLHEDNEYNIPVVLKTLTGVYSEKETAKLSNEYEILRELDIPGVRKAYRLIGFEEGQVLVLEYIEGETLEKTCIKQKQTLPYILKIMTGITRIVHNLHINQVIHNYITGSNILIDSNSNSVFLIDFELAARTDSEKANRINTEMAEGSLHYMSPEQTGRLNLRIDYRSDLYSLGVLFYGMLTNRLPFEDEDAAELIHCHIAKIPKPVYLARPGIPVVLSEIVMKLLAKAPEDRYQSTFGLLTDLEKCLQQLVSQNKISRFPLAQKDYSGRLVIPHKLYGRDNELEILKQSVDRLCNGTGEVLLISGMAGLGKSLLIKEVREYVSSRNCYIVSGVHIQGHMTPYYGLVKALDELVNIILSEGEENIVKRKEEIRKALGRYGKLITDMIPSLERIIGKQPEISDLNPVETQARFHYVLQKFIRAIARKEHPVVLFIDNMQWADEALLAFTETFLSGRENRYLLFIAAYREQEVQSGNTLKKLFQAVKRSGTEITGIQLEAINTDVLNKFISDCLQCDPDYALPLSMLVYEKTGGNLFFASRFLQMLYEEGLLYFRYDSLNWLWDLKEIRKKNITDNVIGLMTHKFEKLPETTRNLISLAAHIGYSFDLKTLSVLSGLSVQETLNHLWSAASEGLAVPSDQQMENVRDDVKNAGEENIVFEFPDSSIRQVALDLIPVKIRGMISLEIGRYQLQSMKKSDAGKYIFDITDRFNQGFKYIRDEDEKLQLARLNLAAGQKAKKAMAYKAAIRYLSMGIGLLPQNTKWVIHYDLTLALYLEAAEAEYLMTTFERAETLADEVLKHAIHIQEKIKIYQLRIQFFASRNYCSEAISAGVKALKMLDIHLPDEPDEIKDNIASLSKKISDYENPEIYIFELPDIQNNRFELAIQILSSMTAPAHQSNPDLLDLIVLMMMDYTISYGITPYAAFACAWYGILLCTPEGNQKRGVLFGDIALKLAEKLDNSDLKYKVNFLTNNYIKPWDNLTFNRLPHPDEICAPSIDYGDMVYGYFGALHHCSYYFCLGYPIKQVRVKLAQYLEETVRFRLNFHKDYSRIWKQTVRNLQDQTTNPHILSGGILDAEKFIPEWKSQSNYILLFSYYCCQTMTGYLFRQYETAIKSGKEGELYEKGGRSSIYLPLHNFYYALSMTAAYDEASAGEKEFYNAEIDRIESKMRFWADSSPALFKHKLDLILAEKARINGDYANALILLGAGIKSASESGIIQDLGTAYDLEASLFIRMDREDLAAFSAGKSIECIRNWGAVSLAQFMEKVYFQILDKSEEKGSVTDYRNKEELISDPGFNIQTMDFLDSSAVIRATYTLSQELNPEKLLVKMVKIVIENSGAQKVVIIKYDENKLLVRAIGRAGSEEIFTGEKIFTNEYSEAPSSIINYVVRTNASVVINDALEENIFSTDQYFSQNHPKSLLCMPVIYNSKLIGLLYLENNLTANVFTRSRQDILHFLMTQSSISLSNASLYSRLEKKIEELEETRDILREAEERYRSLVENIDMGISLIDKNHNIIMTNAGMGKIFHKQSAEFEGKKCFCEYEKRSSVCAHCPGIKAMATGKPHQVETTGYKDDGEQTFAHIYAYPVFDKNNEISGFIELVEDTTERKKTEKAKLETEAKYKLIIDTANEGVVIINTDDKMVFVNSRMAEMLGYKIEELTGASMYYIKFPEDVEQQKKVIEGRRQFKQEQYETRFRKANDEEMWAIVSATPVITPEGNYGGSFAMLTDITSRKKAERELEAARLNLEQQVAARTRELAGAIDELRETQAQLVESEKMAALATLVAGVAHEINTPVGIGITAASHLAERCNYYENLCIEQKLKKSDLNEFIYIIREGSKLILDNLDRADKLVQNFKQVSVNQSSGERTLFNIREVMLDMLERLKHRLKTDAFGINLECPEDLEIDSYPAALYRIMANLFVNSLIHGFDDKDTGIISIKIEKVKDRVIIQFSDNGKGIDLEDLSHIFEPFYTTRRNTGGTGLGLHIVYNLVTQSLKGRITCQSEPGLGTTFTINIPAQARS
ncbi:MAG: PAS domain S-box protein [Firmicutes bacterium]|nr:PAS domain S-box protein [Bacillota bacterium]